MSLFSVATVGRGCVHQPEGILHWQCRAQYLDGCRDFDHAHQASLELACHCGAEAVLTDQLWPRQFVSLVSVGTQLQF